MGRRSYPSDVTDEEWALVAPYLTLMREDAPQREYPLREMFNALRYVVRTGIPWRWLPNDFPPWEAVYAQAQRWLRAGVFEALVHDLRLLLRILQGRNPHPSAVILDSRTLPSTPESGHRGGYDGAKRRRGREVHVAVDTLGHLLALVVTLAEVGDGERAAEAARGEGVELVVVRLPEARRGFVLLPRRWVVEGSFAWLTRFRRLVRDYERLPQTLAGLHFVAFAMLLAQRKGRGAGGRRAPHPLHLLERGAGTPRLRPG